MIRAGGGGQKEKFERGGLETHSSNLCDESKKQISRNLRPTPPGAVFGPLSRAPAPLPLTPPAARTAPDPALPPPPSWPSPVEVEGSIYALRWLEKINLSPTKKIFGVITTPCQPRAGTERYTRCLPACFTTQPPCQSPPCQLGRTTLEEAAQTLSRCGSTLAFVQPSSACLLGSSLSPLQTTIPEHHSWFRHQMVIWFARQRKRFSSSASRPWACDVCVFVMSLMFYSVQFCSGPSESDK